VRTPHRTGPFATAEAVGFAVKSRCIARATPYKSNERTGERKRERERETEIVAARGRRGTRVRFRGARRDLSSPLLSSSRSRLLAFSRKPRGKGVEREGRRESPAHRRPRAADYVDIKYHEVHSASRFRNENDAASSSRPIAPAY
jgi:hypothetical protein